MNVFGIGIFLIVISIFMTANSLIRYKKFGIMTSEEQDKYRLISKKQKEDRTEEEQKFYFENQETYFNLKVGKISFQVGSILIIIGLIQAFFQK